MPRESALRACDGGVIAAFVRFFSTLSGNLRPSPALASCADGSGSRVSILSGGCESYTEGSSVA